MTFDGSAAPSDGGGSLKPSPTVHGESIAFIGNEVTNRHTAICFAVGSEQYGRAPRAVIRRNRIHDCGRLPPTNHEHGIYLHSPCCVQVTDNWVYDNADTGIQMFPDADGNYIARNVVYGNGDNISFGGDSKDGGCASSDDNIVERNVLSHPRVKENVGSWSGCGKHGTGNVLRENCIWPPTFQKAGEGFALREQLLRRAGVRERGGQGLPHRAGHAVRAAGHRSRRRAPGGGSSKSGDAGAGAQEQPSLRCASAGASCCRGASTGGAAGTARAHPGAARQQLAARAQRAARQGGALPCRAAPAAAQAGKLVLGAAQLPLRHAQAAPAGERPGRRLLGVRAPAYPPLATAQRCCRSQPLAVAAGSGSVAPRRARSAARAA